MHITHMDIKHIDIRYIDIRYIGSRHVDVRYIDRYCLCFSMAEEAFRCHVLHHAPYEVAQGFRPFRQNHGMELLVWIGCEEATAGNPLSKHVHHGTQFDERA